MLYTGKGDKGDTSFFGYKQRFSKNSALAEALGSVDEIEKQLPLIKSFFIAGGTELFALFDYARAVSRQAERKTVAFSESKKNKALPRSEPTTGSSTTGVSPEILAYLNRLSSFLYAVARLVNFNIGVKDRPPSYHGGLIQ